MENRIYRKNAGFINFYFMLVLALALVFWAGYEFASIQKGKLQETNNLQYKSLANLAKEHEKLLSDFNMLKVEFDIQALASESDQSAQKEIMSREQTLKEQLSFYQRVLAPEKTQDGFVLERMEITPTLSDNNYAIKIILLQHENIKAVIKGKLDIQVFGSEAGKPVSYSVNKLQGNKEIAFDFAFKYFQVLETNITFPSDFSPERFEISTDIFKYKRKRGEYSTMIKWNDAFSEAE